MMSTPLRCLCLQHRSCKTPISSPPLMDSPRLLRDCLVRPFFGGRRNPFKSGSPPKWAVGGCKWCAHWTKKKNVSTQIDSSSVDRPTKLRRPGPLRFSSTLTLPSAVQLGQGRRLIVHQGPTSSNLRQSTLNAWWSRLRGLRLQHNFGSVNTDETAERSGTPQP